MHSNSNQLSKKDFQFIHILGSGSFGKVYLVKKYQDNQNYAIKTVLISKMSQKQKQSALNQVRLLASINIPYVVGYKGAFFDIQKQQLCIIMEYCDGGDLQKKVLGLINKAQKGFQQTFIWKVAYEIFHGLKLLHKKNIIHRDIKSGNIFFANGIAKIGDLNVSKIAQQGFCQTQTGTPYYTSPQIWKGQQYSSKCDIWSTGCLLYEMCTLTHPFQGKDFPTLYRKIIFGDYKEIPNYYSNELKQLIRMCLTVDDQLRPSATKILQTAVLNGMSQNMQKFDCNGQINLIDPIRCPKVLKFLNAKLPKAYQGKKKQKKRTVAFNDKQQQKNSEKQQEKDQKNNFRNVIPCRSLIFINKTQQIHQQINQNRAKTKKLVPSGVQLNEQINSSKRFIRNGSGKNIQSKKAIIQNVSKQIQNQSKSELISLKFIQKIQKTLTKISSNNISSKILEQIKKNTIINDKIKIKINSSLHQNQNKI